MDVTRIVPEDSDYPAAVKAELAEPPLLSAIGNRELLKCRLLAFFCSVKCPGNLILQTYDLARALRDTGVPIIGGFHSPMEKECLALLLRGTQPVIICPARGIATMRIPGPWKKPLEEGRLLVVSPFADKVRRITGETSRTRNAFVAALAQQVFVAHAAPGSKTEALCKEIISSGKPVLTLTGTENEHLLRAGVGVLTEQKEFCRHLSGPNSDL